MASSNKYSRLTQEIRPLPVEPERAYAPHPSAGAWASRPAASPFFIRLLRRRWLALSFCAAVAAGVAAGVAYQFGTPEYTVTGSLIYSKLPSLTESGYTGPDVYTAAALLRNAEILAKINAEFNLTDAKAVAKNMLEQVPRGTEILEISLAWGNADQGVEIVNRLMELFSDQVANIRRGKVEEYMLDAEANLERRLREVGTANNQLRKFQRENKVWNVDEDIRSIAAAQVDVESSMITAQYTERSLQGQLETIKKTQQETVRNIKKKMLEAKQADFDQAIAVYAEGAKARKRLEGMGPDLEALSGHLDEEISIEDWAESLATLSKRYLGKEQDNAQADEILTRFERTLLAAAEKQTEFEINLEPKAVEITLLQQRLTGMTGELKRLRDLREQSLNLSGALEEASRARQGAADHYNALRQLKDSNAREFTVINDPLPGPAGLSPYTQKLILGSFLVAAILLSLPVVAYEFFSTRENPADAAGRQFGLPVLSRRSLSVPLNYQRQVRTDDEQDAVRLLALRIQQSIPRPGSIILFSALNRPDSPMALIADLAKCFAERDERVLVIDAARSPQSQQTLASLLPDSMDTPEQKASSNRALIDPTKTLPRMPGLADFVSFDCVDLADIVLPTRIPGVDCIWSGTLAFPREGLATQRMTELVEQCRRQYSLILVAGPSTTQAADLQMLAARVDGILFTAGSGGRPTQRDQEVVEELVGLDAPILGVIG